MHDAACSFSASKTLQIFTPAEGNIMSTIAWCTALYFKLSVLWPVPESKVLLLASAAHMLATVQILLTLLLKVLCTLLPMLLTQAHAPFVLS